MDSRLENKKFLAIFVAFALGICLSECANAQMPDYCVAALAFRDSPPVALDWRLRCTIQKLQAERVQQADRATQDEVEIARLAALLKDAQAALDAARTKLQKHGIK